MTWIQRTFTVLLAAGALTAQDKPAAPQSTAEIAQHDEAATFRTRVNLVMAPVVVRNRKGDAVGNLEKADFTLFDKGKPQDITRFSVERTAPGEVENADKKIATPEGEAPPAGLPDRFVAYVFDDIHSEFADLARTRDAAWEQMQHLQKNDRAAIFTTSGQVELEFTDDRDKFHESLMRLRPHPIARSGMQECPDINYYMADLIFNKHDPTALQAEILETMACMNLSGPGAQQQAQQIVDATSQRVMNTGNHETRVALLVLKDIVRRLAGAPGQRVLILTSPGFITPENLPDVAELLDRAIRAKVVINTLDARGLYTDPSLDASRRTFDSNATRMKSIIERQAASAQADVLAILASGTGGAFVQNTNDLAGGFERLATAPEYIYLLGFSPQNLKLDGSFHSLKVSLKNSGPLAVEARKGYYAPKRLEDAAETAKREVEEALFSREEMHDLPVELRTQFFKSGDRTAKLAVLAHMDIRKLKFRKAGGRNNDEVTVVSGLFDRNGNYVQGLVKKIQFRLLDQTLENRLGQGITVRTSFDVKPGTYMIRLVVRDAEGQLMSAANGAVEIP